MELRALVGPLAVVAFRCAVGLACPPAGHSPAAVVRCRGLGREVLDGGLRCVQRLIIVACRLQSSRLLLLAVVLRGSLGAGGGIVGVLAAALIAFVFLIAVLGDLHQASVRGVRVRLVCARYAAVGEVAVLKVVYLLLLHIVRLGASTGSVHQIHIVALVLLEFALLLLLGLHALVHLICHVQGYLLVRARMRVEKLVGLLGAEEEDPVLQVLLLELRHLLVHDERLREVLELALALALDLRIDLDEDLEIARHHVRQGIAARLHLLQRVVDVLYLLLPLQLALLRLQLVQFLQQRFDLGDPLLAKLPDVRALLQQGNEVAPDNVGAHGYQAQDLPVGAGLINEVEGLGPGNVLEELLGEGNDHGLVILEELYVNVHLLLFFVVQGLHLGALRLQYSTMGIGGPRSIIH